jgi:hypothetical protein
VLSFVLVCIVCVDVCAAVELCSPAGSPSARTVLSISLSLGNSHSLPVGLAGILDRAVRVGAKDLLEAVLRLHLGTQGGGAKGYGEGLLSALRHGVETQLRHHERLEHGLRWDGFRYRT